ncbi:hypothetical protein WK91_18430 [Burkholderia cepacia]|nr:hypothetical protein WK91_18430 [Burkholderia cepacia]
MRLSRFCQQSVDGGFGGLKTFFLPEDQEVLRNFRIDTKRNETRLRVEARHALCLLFLWFMVIGYWFMVSFRSGFFWGPSRFR